MKKIKSIIKNKDKYTIQEKILFIISQCKTENKLRKSQQPKF